MSGCSDICLQAELRRSMLAAAPLPSAWRQRAHGLPARPPPQRPVATAERPTAPPHISRSALGATPEQIAHPRCVSLPFLAT